MEENTLLLRSLLRQDWETFQTMVDDFQRRGLGTPVAIIGCTFHVAIRRYFATPTDVPRFMSTAAVDAPIREASALVYTTLKMTMPGAEEILGLLSLGQIAQIQGYLIFALIRWKELDDDALDELLREAEEKLTEIHKQAENGARRVMGQEREKFAMDIARRYAAGETIKAIASSTGRSYGTIQRILTIDLGLTLRPRGTAPLTRCDTCGRMCSAYPVDRD